MIPTLLVITVVFLLCWLRTELNLRWVQIGAPFIHFREKGWIHTYKKMEACQYRIACQREVQRIKDCQKEVQRVSTLQSLSKESRMLSKRDPPLAMTLAGGGSISIALRRLSIIADASAVSGLWFVGGWGWAGDGSAQRFTYPYETFSKKIVVAYGADFLAFELNGEVVSGLPGHRSLENLVLSWVRRVGGEDCLEMLLVFFRQHVRSLAFSLALPSWKIKRTPHFVSFFLQVNWAERSEALSVIEQTLRFCHARCLDRRTDRSLWAVAWRLEFRHRLQRSATSAHWNAEHAPQCQAMSALCGEQRPLLLKSPAMGDGRWTPLKSWMLAGAGLRPRPLREVCAYHDRPIIICKAKKRIELHVSGMARKPRLAYSPDRWA